MTRVSLTDPDRTRAMVEEDSLNVEAPVSYTHLYRQNPRVPAKGTRGFCRLKAVKTAEIPRGVRRDAGVLPL